MNITVDFEALRESLQAPLSCFPACHEFLFAISLLLTEQDRKYCLCSRGNLLTSCELMKSLRSVQIYTVPESRDMKSSKITKINTSRVSRFGLEITASVWGQKLGIHGFHAMQRIERPASCQKGLRLQGVWFRGHCIISGWRVTCSVLDRDFWAFFFPTCLKGSQARDTRDFESACTDSLVRHERTRKQAK